MHSRKRSGCSARTQAAAFREKRICACSSSQLSSLSLPPCLRVLKNHPRPPGQDARDRVRERPRGVRAARERRRGRGELLGARAAPPPPLPQKRQLFVTLSRRARMPFVTSCLISHSSFLITLCAVHCSLMPRLVLSCLVLSRACVSCAGPQRRRRRRGRLRAAARPGGGAQRRGCARHACSRTAEQRHAASYMLMCAPGVRVVRARVCNRHETGAAQSIRRPAQASSFCAWGGCSEGGNPGGCRRGRRPLGFLGRSSPFLHGTCWRMLARSLGRSLA